MTQKNRGAEKLMQPLRLDVPVFVLFFSGCVCVPLSVQKQLVGYVIHVLYLVAKVTHEIRISVNCPCLKDQ